MHEVYRARNHTEEIKGNNGNGIYLSSNPTLERLAVEISKANPIIEQINLLSLRRNNGNGKRQEIGKLAEVHLACVLESLKDEYTDINLSPIPNDTLVGKYRFKQSGVNYIIYQEPRPSSAILEYDILSEINGLPVVWEVKLGKSIQPAIRNQRIKSILQPLKEYYGDRDFGYALVVPKNMLNPESEIQNKFTSKGGIIVPLYADKSELEADINGN